MTPSLRGIGETMQQAVRQGVILQIFYKYITGHRSVTTIIISTEYLKLFFLFADSSGYKCALTVLRLMTLKTIYVTKYLWK